MKFNRTASVNWKGTGMEGKGTVNTQSTVLNDTQLSFKTRFEQGIGTNPEELVGAAHAGCFSMQLAFLIQEEGFEATNLDTNATVYFEDGAIIKIELDLTGEVPSISKEQFEQFALKAKEICPISKLMNTEIVLNIEFVG